jgi:hypothetical protein
MVPSLLRYPEQSEWDVALGSNGDLGWSGNDESHEKSDGGADKEAGEDTEDSDDDEDTIHARAPRHDVEISERLNDADEAVKDTESLAEIHFLVSSKHMILVSKVFKAMLAGNFK